MWYSAKAVFNMKFVVWSVYMGKEEMSKIPEIQNSQGARKVRTKYPQNEYKKVDNKEQKLMK